MLPAWTCFPSLFNSLFCSQSFALCQGFRARYFFYSSCAFALTTLDTRLGVILFNFGSFFVHLFDLLPWAALQAGYFEGFRIKITELTPRIPKNQAFAGWWSFAFTKM